LMHTTATPFALPSPLANHGCVQVACLVGRAAGARGRTRVAALDSCAIFNKSLQSDAQSGPRRKNRRGPPCLAPAAPCLGKPGVDRPSTQPPRAHQMLSTTPAQAQPRPTALSTHAHEQITEHLAFLPMSLIDDVINAMNEFVFQAMASLESFVAEWYGAELEVEQVRFLRGLTNGWREYPSSRRCC